MKSRTALLGAAAVAACATLATAEDAPAPSVQALAWMTGTWAGPLGPNELEENWTVPKAGSMQALVRMTGGGKTSMVELIVIEEEEGSLTLHLQQWGPGYQPLPQGPAKMKLVDMGENTVAFESLTEGTIKKLRYTRDGDNFTISVENPDGGTIDIPLQAVR